ncbi:MAG: hypothetical protein O7C62_06895 [Rickettsia endosymbiont of Ixodes persulcatus]|nr:hypothetical protein [Rickettsia endosymbiont of Ixodes persulcatus]
MREGHESVPRNISGISSGKRRIQASPIIMLSKTKTATDIVLTRLKTILIA